MKILHITPTYDPAVGGAEVHLRQISERLVSRGHDVTVITHNVRSHWDLGSGCCANLPPTEIKAGVRLVRISPEADLLGRALSRWLELKGGWRSASWLFGWDGLEMLSEGPRTLGMIPHILRSETDIVASMNWYWPLAYHSYLARNLKHFTLVGIPLFHTAQAWCERKVYRKMLPSCDAVIVNTAHEGQFAHDRGAKRVEVAGVGIDPQGFKRRNGQEIRARYGLGNYPVVGFVGRQEVKKGVVKLVEAMRAVWEWNKEVRLILAGSRPLYPKELEIAIDKLAAAEKQRIIHFGRFDEEEKGSLFDAFDVFALPSTEESFGIAYLEAWLCRKPVIGARIGSTQCVIDEGSDGLLADSEDPEDIARAIVTLLANPQRREQMGRCGYDKTISQHTWDKVTDRIETLYLALASSRKKKPIRKQSVKPW